MKCEKIINEFLRSESNRVPLLIRLHLLQCAQCRHEIADLQNKIAMLRSDSAYKLPFDMTAQIMNRISLLGEIHARDLSDSKWIVTGVTIVASIILVTYSEPFRWLDRYFGGSFEIPLNIVMGIVITIYSAFYIGTRLDRLKGKLNGK